MAEEYCGGANWWDSSPNNTRSARFDGSRGGGGGDSTASSTTTLPNSGGGATTGYGWLTETSTTDTKLDTSSLQLMGLGLSNTPAMDWNQHHILNPEKAENSFRSILQDGMGLSTNFQQETGGAGGIFSNSSQVQWRPEKLFPNNEESLEFKQIGVRGFSLDQHSQFSPSCSSMDSTITCNNNNHNNNHNNNNNNNNNNPGFQLDSSLSSSVYGSPSSILQGLLGPDQHTNQQQQLNYGAPNQQSYFGMPQFLKTSSPKQQQQQQQQQLQFMNNPPYWNASSPGVLMNNDVRPSFFSSLQAPPQLSMPSFEEKPKTTTMESRDTNMMVKKSNSQESNTKRARNDGASSTLPPFKVRKEKMGDRITALQQLVSPFGKTDTASVLSEAIEYIKFLHEQVSVLSNPYLKSGAAYQQQQQQSSNEKGKIDQEGPKQDLRSRGLCLVPVSSTFPMAHETTVDFWTPTFGGTFR